MASEKIDYVVRTINRRVPEHSVGLISPPEMLRTGSGNCLGKTSLLAAGLVVDGVLALSEMSILISRSHGMINGVERPWYGHAALVIPGNSFMDAKTIIEERPKDELNWDDPTQPYDSLGARFVHAMRIVGHPTPEIREALFEYSVYSVLDGIAQYQQQHEELQNSGEVWTLPDYTAAYRSMVGPGE